LLVLVFISTTMTMASTALPWKYRLLEPHAAFWLTSLIVKQTLPSFLKWLACDTISTTILSVWYPFVATVSLIHSESQPEASQSQPQTKNQSKATRDRKFWISYWAVGYSLAQFVHHGLLTMPAVLRWSTQYSWLSQAMAELKFLYFIWIYAMEPLLVEYQRFLALDKEAENWKDFTPLIFLKRTIRPRLLEVQSKMSDPITREAWKRFIHSKAHKIFNLLVALQFLSEEMSDYLLQLLDECRSLLLLAPFLILPSSITQVGILYAQFVLPSARSLLARGKIVEVLYLQYWVLNNLLSTYVSLGSWVWWFVPFSTQFIFAAWCYLTFPRTITEYYAVVETELIAFGILSGESQVPVEETKTVQALRAVVSRLPSANDAEGFQWADSDGIDNRYGTKSQRELVPRSRSAPATLLAISAIKAMHDSGLLSPQQESGEDEFSDDEGHGLAKLSKSLSAKDDVAGLKDPPFFDSNSTKYEDEALPPSVSMIEESDDSSQFSSTAMVNVDISSENKNVYKQVEVAMKDLTAARLRASKFKGNQRNNHNISNPKQYNIPLHSSIMVTMSDEQKRRPSSPPVLGTRSSSDSCTPSRSANGGFDLSDVDTTISSSGIGGGESFDSAGALYDGSTKYRRNGSQYGVDDVTRYSARRSERIRNLHEKREKREPQNYTQSLHLMRSASSDESDGKSAGSKFSRSSSSTANYAVTSPSEKRASPDRMMRHRRQRGGDNQVSESTLPKYIQMNSSDAARERMARRGGSRDTIPLVAVDSDEVAQ
jgi:hypothetical protein